MAKEDIEFISEDNQRFSQKIDYNIVIMEQINKVRTSGSVEFRGGYWEERKRVIAGSVVNERVYIPDTRQVYIGAITQLYDLLLPFFDGKFRKSDLKIQGRIKALVEKKDVKRKELDKSKYNVWYYSSLKKIKRKQYKGLVLLMARLGMFGIKKSKEIY